MDELFRLAVSAIDTGDVPALQQLLADNPILISQRLDAPGRWLRDTVGQALDGFFARPYLLWFIAEDPVRNGTLPPKIADVTRTLVGATQHAGVECRQEQLDYALTLVSWSWIARDCGVQIELIDILIDAGATPAGNAENALINSNFEAAAHLIGRGDSLTLAAALCLGRWDDVDRLAAGATAAQKQFALVLAALKGKSQALRRIIEIGIDVDAVSPNLYSHASPLHHAVHSGSLEAVRVLVEAGANLDARDTTYYGTPLDWAEYSSGKERYDEIAVYLRAQRQAP